MIGSAAHAFQDMEALGFTDGKNAESGGPAPDANLRDLITREGIRFGATALKLDILYRRGYSNGVALSRMDKEFN